MSKFWVGNGEQAGLLFVRQITRSCVPFTLKQKCPAGFDLTVTMPSSPVNSTD